MNDADWNTQCAGNGFDGQLRSASSETSNRFAKVIILENNGYRQILLTVSNTSETRPSRYVFLAAKAQRRGTATK
jgi:hypothetical protein